ncbi:ParA family protein [Methylovirgula sp. 4M-Z18]|uniref:ParA family protein n=1 Tax=Methylovirgula sp. 4M-Z18 TaxID=2293567 RepID=UPI000E2EC8C2|nr:ParA family protein [Methylovirgula sp. 4M-Z18]RFB81419.1 ParA family protein [Methylovirgula sp. 4M-Z18]
MGKIVCFISEKGGVGKTTACFEIAIALTHVHKLKVLVIDADYQRGGITGRLEPGLIPHFTKGEMPGTSLFHKFQQIYSAMPLTLNLDIRKSQFNIDFVPADPRLSSVSEDKLPSGKTIKQNNKLMLSHLMTVGAVLEPLKLQYDYILIDCHPEVSSLLRAAIYASDYAVSPVKLDLQSSIGVPTVIAEIDGVNDDVAAIMTTLGEPATYTPTTFSGAIGMMAREYASDLKASESAEYNRIARTGKIFARYVTEGDGLRQAAQYRTSVRYINGQNASKQTSQINAVTAEFLTKCP